jgi:hypothetical protein
MIVFFYIALCSSFFLLVKLCVWMIPGVTAVNFLFAFHCWQARTKTLSLDPRSPPGGEVERTPIVVEETVRQVSSPSLNPY